MRTNKTMTTPTPPPTPEQKSPISYHDLIDHPEKRAEYLTLHDARIEDDDGTRILSDGSKVQTDRRLGYSMVWKHGCMHIGHRTRRDLAELWAVLFIYFWKYHKVSADVLDHMLYEITGIEYLRDQRDQALARAEKAEVEREAKATLFPRWRPASERGPEFEDGEAMLVAVRVAELGQPSWWDIAFVTIQCDEGRFGVLCEGEPWGWEWCDVVYYIPARELTASISDAPPAEKEQA